MTIYLEEEVTKHVEFPTDGKFTTIDFGRYRVCGDASMGEHSTDEPRPFTSKSWAIPRPWINTAGPSGSLLRKKATQPYDVYLKRSIPYVALGLDQSNRNIIVDSTINNVYIKVPENTVSAQTILSAMATKIGCDASSLVILDVKFLEISDDKGKTLLCY